MEIALPSHPISSVDEGQKLNTPEARRMSQSIRAVFEDDAANRMRFVPDEGTHKRHPPGYMVNVSRARKVSV